MTLPFFQARRQFVLAPTPHLSTLILHVKHFLHVSTHLTLFQLISSVFECLQVNSKQKRRNLNSDDDESSDDERNSKKSLNHKQLQRTPSASSNRSDQSADTPRSDQRFNNVHSVCYFVFAFVFVFVLVYIFVFICFTYVDVHSKCGVTLQMELHCLGSFVACSVFDGLKRSNPANTIHATKLRNNLVICARLSLI